MTLPDALLDSPLFQLERLRRLTRDAVEAALPVPIREYWVLTCLASHEAASQRSLSSLLLIDASDMVRIIDDLQDNGWAKRSPDPQDRRRTIVSITKKGRNRQAKWEEQVIAAENAALDESTAKQLKHLRRLATAVIE